MIKEKSEKEEVDLLTLLKSEGIILRSHLQGKFFGAVMCIDGSGVFDLII